MFLVLGPLRNCKAKYYQALWKMLVTQKLGFNFAAFRLWQSAELAVFEDVRVSCKISGSYEFCYSADNLDCAQEFLCVIYCEIVCRVYVSALTRQHKLRQRLVHTISSDRFWCKYTRSRLIPRDVCATRVCHFRFFVER